MAVDLKNLIDLNLLTYYDEKLKSWTLGQIGSGGIQLSSIQFVDTLPTIGQSDILYVMGTSLYIWDGSAFQIINAEGGSENPNVQNAVLWGTF